MTHGEGRSTGFFYGLQPRWLGSDRLYRVYVSDSMLAGAYVAGQVYDELSAAVQLQGLGLFLRPLVRRGFARRRDREALYDDLDPFGPELAAQDPRNFQIPRSDVARTRFRRTRSLWTPVNVGSVEFEFRDGTRRRFILVGDQDPDAVLGMVRRFDPGVEVTGRPNQRPRPRPLSPAGKRLTFGMLSGLHLGFGVLFGYVAWAGVAPNPIYWPLAVVSVAAGGWSLVKAWKAPGDQPQPEAVAGPDGASDRGPPQPRPGV